MKDLILATHNEHKVEEVKAILDNYFNILSLTDIDCHDEIPETGLTFQANAKQKASYINNKYDKNCFADDSGLEVEALHGEPGIYSARYAGEPCNDHNNMYKLLQEMKGKTNRNAQFRTVISLIYNQKTYFFEGIIRGTLKEEPAGENGFGYDPIFVPEGYEESFAQLSAEIKNTISHRGKAIEKLRAFLVEQN